jgi:hypothetical protein
MESDAKKAAKLTYELEQDSSTEKQKELTDFEKYCMEKYGDKEEEFNRIYEEELSRLSKETDDPLTENNGINEEEESKSSEETDDSSTGNSGNWDKILGDYDKFADQYIKLFKKAQAGDMSALSEYTSALTKAESLAKQLENAGSDLTSTQLAKFTEIQTKMATAAIEASTSKETDNSSTGNSGNWDKVLSDYDKFADQYIKLFKKAQAGDMSALSEYSSVLKKAESLAKQLENAGSDLTSAQLAKFTKTQTKMANAAMGQ